ncbi:hypothetical protein E2K93_09950 [Thalassotalea sp. HSM 43]|uniref:hypothetical protein n=1 Tax=Thalassotalea sp. HSM 43 TaxID=2552945 RepID=UPI0010822956|nr:hypothetical protein [Thalassotalea sp. HSM 43]QBY04693.1 hypothetical protein E2K93_09950 [Thalassotalea sp. HSM 43]
MSLFSGIVTLLVFILGGLVTFAYKKPKAYSVFLEKLLNGFLSMLTGAYGVCVGMDMLIRHNDLSYDITGAFVLILPDFKYIWAIPLSFFVVWVSLHSLGKFMNELKQAEDG